MKSRTSLTVIRADDDCEIEPDSGHRFHADLLADESHGDDDDDDDDRHVMAMSLFAEP
jgi:hypothetical protein